MCGLPRFWVTPWIWYRIPKEFKTSLVFKQKCSSENFGENFTRIFRVDSVSHLVSTWDSQEQVFDGPFVWFHWTGLEWTFDVRLLRPERFFSIQLQMKSLTDENIFFVLNFNVVFTTKLKNVFNINTIVQKQIISDKNHNQISRLVLSIHPWF